MAITNLINRALGAPSIQVFPKSQYKVIKQIADLLNSIILNGTIIRRPSTVAINATATATVDQILSGYITSTSAAATSITTPTATALATVDVTVANVETINVKTEDTATTLGNIAHALDLNAAAATKIVVSGNAGVDFTGTATSTDLTSLDASAVTAGAVTYT